LNRSSFIMLAILCMTLVPLAFAPHAAASCDQRRTEVLGQGDESTGIYSRDKSDPRTGGCDPSYWQAHCSDTIFSPPPSVKVEEVRVLGQVVVPATSIPVPGGIPSVSITNDPKGCGVSGTDYGVYDADRRGSPYELRDAYVGTDRCWGSNWTPYLIGYGISQVCFALP
jgi:hypothetical protein